MEGKSILLDTGILIDYFRKKDKSKSILFKLSLESFHFHVSAVTQYEILLGATDSQIEFWTIFFDKVQVLPFDQNSALAASVIYKQLKSENKLIDIADILIASIAVTNQIPLVTLNHKHFSRIKGIEILTSEHLT